MTHFDDMTFGLISSLLESRTGQALTEERRWRVGTVLSPLFREYGITTSSQLVATITREENSPFVREMIDALLNNESYFFRDLAVFQNLRQKVLPELAEKRADKKQLTIWSVGCSTGQEALSLAMLFAEQPKMWEGWRIDIAGTDVSGKAISVARRGIYSHFEVQRGLSIGQMLRFFEESAVGWKVNPELARMVRYNEANFLEPTARTGKFDLILCRNVLLYFDLATRTRAFQRLGEAMRPHSRLLLGGGETVVGQTGYVRTVDNKFGVYELDTSGAEQAKPSVAASTA